DAGACSPDVTPRSLEKLGWKLLQCDDVQRGKAEIRLYRRNKGALELATVLAELWQSPSTGNPTVFKLESAELHRGGKLPAPWLEDYSRVVGDRQQRYTTRRTVSALGDGGIEQLSVSPLEVSRSATDLYEQVPMDSYEVALGPDGGIPSPISPESAPLEPTGW